LQLPSCAIPTLAAVSGDQAVAACQSYHDNDSAATAAISWSDNE